MNGMFRDLQVLSNNDGFLLLLASECSKWTVIATTDPFRIGYSLITLNTLSCFTVLFLRVANLYKQ